MIDPFQQKEVLTMKIVPCAFQLPNGEMLTVRSLCADDAEALNAFRLATYRDEIMMVKML